MNKGDLVTKSLKELEKIKKDNILDSKTNKDIEKCIDKVNNIIKDDKVKIAILGEFSSGKSTFINALLGSKVLSYADEPTTSINTYITYGIKEKTTVNFTNGSKKIINISQIEQYTKEGVVKNNVENVIIEMPNNTLKKGMTIIDTPGGNIDNKSHNIQRDKAIEECSIGIFIISAGSLTSNSFIQFLKNYKDKLSKFIFVISKCDILEDDGIDVDIYEGDKIKEVINFTKQCIVKFAGLNNPSIYPISAYNFLHSRKSSVIDVNKSFLTLEHDIDKIHKKEKQQLILFEIYKVIEKTSKIINEVLGNKNRLCELEISRVSGEIESFDRFAFENYKTLINYLENSITECEKNIYKNIADIKKSKIKEIEGRLNGINTMSSLKDSINSISKKGMESFITSCENSITQTVNSVGYKEFKIIENNFSLYFENISRAYKKLGIETIIKFKGIIKKLLVASISFIVSYYSLKVLTRVMNFKLFGFYWIMVPWIVALIVFLIALYTEKDEVVYHIPYENQSTNIDFTFSSIEKNVSNETTEGVGLGAGAVIGALAGGPIGALIGATVGTVLSGYLLKDRMNELKKECIDSVKEGMNNIEIQLQVGIKSILNKKRDSIIKEYEKYVGENMGLHKELLDGIYKYNNKRFIGLRTTNDKLKYYVKVFNKINKEINFETRKR
ncbi:dynamin family protein [Terrisporobacter sp.]